MPKIRGIVHIMLGIRYDLSWKSKMADILVSKSLPSEIKAPFELVFGFKSLSVGFLDTEALRFLSFVFARRIGDVLLRICYTF